RLKIHSTTGGLASTNAYLIADVATKQAVFFDAPDHTMTPLIQVARAEGYDVIGLWLTHAHFDHFADHAVVTEAFPNAKVLLHPLDAAKMRSPTLQTRMFQLPFTIPGREADAPVNDGDVLRIGETEVRAIHTPGHAPGHVMYWFPSDGVLVGGDLIICGAVGRTDFPESDEDQLIESIRKVYATCPDETQLLPGHCEETTLGQERRTNVYVREVLRG
ncbi:MAG: MBL fold metallo-hydrolase, partial [Phycisphaerae bacterium]